MAQRQPLQPMETNKHYPRNEDCRCPGCSIILAEREKVKGITSLETERGRQGLQLAKLEKADSTLQAEWVIQKERMELQQQAESDRLMQIRTTIMQALTYTRIPLVVWAIAWAFVSIFGK